MKDKIAIVGKGKVGQSIAQLMQRSGFDVSVHDREIVDDPEPLTNADVVLLTVNDDSIADVCEQLSGNFKDGAVVAHCSGSLSSDVLVSAQSAGCSIASAHPLNTFPNLSSSLKTFSSTKHGTYLYSEGQRQALDVILPLFQSIGFNTVELKSKAKPAYHAACVFACNYLAVLMDLSLRSAEAAELDRDKFWRAIQPLLSSTLDNIDVYGPVDALSGPIARGDAHTVAAHMTSLSDTPQQLGEAYALLGIHALRLAKQGGGLSDEKYKAIEELLK